ncbi:acyl-CoA dehydrogenase [Gordonia rhizosphera NBRC 16068]|uniref:Acyl-CoA dehydrogenase n=1 Tax=Gordonia rhizosphera NBRC 16068 TaxID=1108045 RepID=K6WL35_9ACTN|nr:acyl-CoA dehydrogenase [Gordonia rhizosphera NBRC 16068]
MQRTVFTEDHETFRKTIRDFIAKEVVPQYDDWCKQGHPPREFYHRLGELGVLGIEAPEEYGGGGTKDFTYSMVIAEETSAAGVSFGSYSVHTNLILPYLTEYASQEQKQR